MKRPDSDLIRRLVKAGGLKTDRQSMLHRALQLPYFHFSHKLMDEFDFKTDDYVMELENGRDEEHRPDNVLNGHAVRVIEQRDDNRALVRSYASSAEFVYEEFVLSAKNKIQLKHHDFYEETFVNYWGVVEEGETKDLVIMLIEYPDTGQILSWDGWAEGGDTITEDGQSVHRINMVMAPEYEETMRRFHQRMLSQNRISGEGGFDNFMSGITAQAASYYLFVCRLMGHIKYGDKHVVEVTPTPDRLAKAKRNPANRKRPWNKASGPNVLLLDRMPTEKTEPTGTHASPKPHRRRGYWRTLSHPRFRHHPQYQKQIYVKPSFVGDKQVTYEGNIYRLVEPLEEIS